MLITDQTHAVSHEEVKPSLFRALQDEIAKRTDVLGTRDVSVTVDATFTCSTPSGQVHILKAAVRRFQ